MVSIASAEVLRFHLLLMLSVYICCVLSVVFCRLFCFRFFVCLFLLFACGFVLVCALSLLSLRFVASATGFTALLTLTQLLTWQIN